MHSKDQEVWHGGWQYFPSVKVLGPKVNIEECPTQPSNPSKRIPISHQKLPVLLLSLNRGFSGAFECTGLRGSLVVCLEGSLAAEAPAHYFYAAKIHSQLLICRQT